MPRFRSIYIDETNITVYKAEISSDLNCLLCLKSLCNPSTCLCFPTVSSKASESTYIYVYQNRLEYNYPLTTITWDCSCKVVDNVKTIYFDREQLNEVYSLDGCLCGYDKTVIIKRPCMSCSDVEVDHCCGKVFLPCVEDAPQLVNHIIEQKNKRLTNLHLHTLTDMKR